MGGMRRLGRLNVNARRGRPPPGPASQAHPPRHPTSLRYAGREGGLKHPARDALVVRRQAYRRIKTAACEERVQMEIILRPRKDFPFPILRSFTDSRPQPRRGLSPWFSPPPTIFSI